MKKEKGQEIYLFRQLVIKDIKIRYQGAVLGLFWSVLMPLLMLVIYTFVFSEVFQAKWNVDTGNKFEFAMVLFCGLSSYNMFSEVLGRSTTLIAENQNYVKKVKFPIEMMPVVITCSALFNCIISYAVLILSNVLLTGKIFATDFFAPVILLPHIAFCIGIAYLVSAISVYLKDMANLASIIIMVGMYVSPVFFPLSSVPANFRFICMLNPITYTIENMRNVMLYGILPNPVYLGISAAMAAAYVGVGYWVFKRAKPGFADLL